MTKKPLRSLFWTALLGACALALLVGCNHENTVHGTVESRNPMRSGPIVYVALGDINDWTTSHRISTLDRSMNGVLVITPYQKSECTRAQKRGPKQGTQWFFGHCTQQNRTDLSLTL